jgi:hypothetical protein
MEVQDMEQFRKKKKLYNFNLSLFAAHPETTAHYPLVLIGLLSYPNKSVAVEVIKFHHPPVLIGLLSYQNTYLMMIH